MADKPDSGSRGKALLGVGGKAGLLAGVAGISTVAGLSAAKALRRRRMINDAYEGEDFTTLRLFDCKSSAVAYVAHLEEHFDYAEMELRDVCMESALACAD